MDLFTVNGYANLVLDMIFLPQATVFPSVDYFTLKGILTSEKISDFVR